MSDYRETFISSVEEQLVNRLDCSDLDIVTSVVMKVLNNYEITERCTDLVPIDPENERIIKRYCACLLVDGKSKNTISLYRRSVTRLSDFYGKSLRDISTYDIRYYLGCRKEDGLSNVSLENQRANFSAFFQWMVDEDLIAKNPMSRIKPIKCPVEVKKPFSDTEIDALRGACKGQKNRALIEVLLSTGVRVSELSSMKVEDVNFSDLSVHVKHGKGDKERITYMTTVAAKHLEKYLNSRSEGNGEWLFYNKNHKVLSSSGIEWILKIVGEAAGVENVHPHRFRRTFATNLARRGMDIQEIQKLLGHNDINTTMKYVVVDSSSVRIAYQKFTA